MKKSLFLRWIFILFLITAMSSQSSAQCAMCRRIAETNIENGNQQGRGLNNGILYMMSVPYLLGGVGLLIWWKYRRANQN